MANINLRSIFCHLTSDENFLSTVIETNKRETGKKKTKKSKYNLMNNMITEYLPLAPYETQNFSFFPAKMKSFISPEYVRLGINNITEKNLNNINISFLNSLNILLRPDLYKASLEEHMRNFALFETFVCHKIERNYQIDKVKNTRKVKLANQELIKNLRDEGKITHNLVQAIINIFEINLLVFDLTKMDIYFYWTNGYKYPYLNLFRNVYCMSYIHGNYEPIMPPDNNISREQRQKIYLEIFSNLDEIKCFPEIIMAPHSLILLNTWDISPDTYIDIIGRFYNKPARNIADIISEALSDLKSLSN